MALTFKVALQSLQDVTQLVQSQVDAGMSAPDVITAKFASYSQRFDALQTIASHQIVELTKASNAGPWTQEQKLKFARIFDEKGELADNKPNKKRPNQKCLTFENFITEDKWIILKNLVKTNTPARQHILAEIAASVNIINPDQPTLYRMVSILAHCEKNYAMSQKEVFNFMDRIKYIIKAKKKDKALPYVEAYPHAADNLPDQIKNHAYPEGLPVVVDIPELTNILGDSKMRGRQDIPADMAWLNEVPPHLKATVLDSVRKQGLAEATHMSQHHSESAPKSETLSSIDLRGKSRRFAVPQAPSFGNLAPRALPSSH
jgi:hypothetical protein